MARNVDTWSVASTESNLADRLRDKVLNWFKSMRDKFHDPKFLLSFIFAVFCVAFIIVGNVIILIAINFWIASFPPKDAYVTSVQIAVQVVSLLFLIIPFGLAVVVFALYYGGDPLRRCLTDRNRVKGPFSRLFMIFASGFTNGECGVLATYAMTYTPPLLQAVLLSVIPFFAQIWTVLLIPEERKRNYLSFWFGASLVFFIAGVLLSSLHNFLHDDAKGTRTPWAWTLIYLLSAVLFGLWCVVQRLYLDWVVFKPGMIHSDASAPNVYEGTRNSQRCTPSERGSSAGEHPYLTRRSASATGREPNDETETKIQKQVSVPTNDVKDDVTCATDPAEVPLLIMEQRQWAQQSLDDKAAKLVMLFGGVFFQLLVTLVMMPIDAAPWFGRSPTLEASWDGFRNSIHYIFSSWDNVRYGLLHSLGFAMSFIGCIYLNENSPTLASVVLQLAAPFTSLVLIIIPQWNIGQEANRLGEKLGGVILLFIAAVLYHVWERNSLKEMIAAANQTEQESPEDVGDLRERRENDVP